MKNKKKVFVVAVAVCLIAILSLSSLAWFSDSDEVTNKFMVANSNEEPDDIFSIDLWEDTDGDGQPDVGKDDNVVGETYVDIYPNQTLPKTPYVENTGSYDQWVRVSVTVDNANAWYTIMARHGLTDLSAIFLNHNEQLWTRFDEPTVLGDELTYVYYLNPKLAPGEKQYLFTDVYIPYQLDENDMALFDNGTFSINIVAEAVQADNTKDNAYDSFALVAQTQPIE